jgi:AmiR/NasT family two-component response regulator
LVFRHVTKDMAVPKEQAVEQSGSYEQARAQSAAEERVFVVAQATGVFMEKFSMSSDEAFAKLVAEAAEGTRSVVALAHEIVGQVGSSDPVQVIEGAREA